MTWVSCSVLSPAVCLLFYLCFIHLAIPPKLCVFFLSITDQRSRPLCLLFSFPLSVPYCSSIHRSEKRIARKLSVVTQTRRVLSRTSSGCGRSRTASCASRPLGTNSWKLTKGRPPLAAGRLKSSRRTNLQSWVARPGGCGGVALYVLGFWGFRVISGTSQSSS